MKTREQVRPTSQVTLPEGSYREAGDLTLADLCALAIRRKRLLLIFFLAAAFSALAWSWSVRPIYESRAVVQIGQLSRVGQPNSNQSSAETIEDFVERLKEEYRVNDVGEDRQLPLVDTIKVNRSAKNIVTITAHGYSSTETRDFLTSVTNKLLADHDARVSSVRRLIDGRIKELQLRLEQTNNQIEALNKGISSISKTNVAAAGILTMEQGMLLQQVVALEKQGAESAMELNELNARPTQILREPTQQQEPIRPKPLLYMLLGAILGLVLGILTAFFLELRFSQRPAQHAESE